ncbi:LON peptidase N-terminal domain and RING finger protein 2 [Battus philenor]|uniref:LON peptidase N-terminal domain and RING finger protein 2 n=1 Tax=Battus philenor TaxID=42288 RepID=UPI0035D0080C
MIASFIDDPFSSSLASMSRKVPKSLRVQTNRPCRDVRSIMASRLPMAPEVRMRFAESLFKAGHLKEGVVQIAKIAAQCSGHSRIARMYLIKTIKKLASGRDPRRLLRELYQLIGNHDTSSWLRNEDIECKLCYEYFRRPLTLSCGHTFCRACIERLLDYRIPCPMCRNYLDETEIAETSESMFLTAVLGNLGIVDDGRLCADEIYILNCIVAFPGIPCPLVVFDPKYKRMVYRALQSGTRQLGILSCNELDYESNNLCGTIVEVCDCVFLENGHCILSTVGVSRFHVLRLSAIAGCDVARIEPIEDIRIRGRLINNINQLALETWQEARDWFTSVHWKVKKSIEDTFGLMPEFLNYVDEVVLKDGPSWLWWFIAILPLREELRALILATPSLKKRLLAVKRTLEAIHEPPTGNIESTESEVYLTLNEDCHEWRSNPTSGRKA